MSRADRILIASGGAALVLAVAAGWVLLSPSVGAADDAAQVLLAVSSAAAAHAEPTASPAGAAIVVDVEGAVVEPGIRELPSGARVADALAAAGGYAPDADLDAAAGALNLAERLSDGAQIVVPRIGAGSVAGAADGDDPGSAGGAGEGPDGPTNLNTASADELEALPGIRSGDRGANHRGAR